MTTQPENDLEVEVPKEEPTSTPTNTQKDWEGSYKGLQRMYDKLKKERDAIQAQYAASLEKVESLEAKARESSASTESIAKQVESKDAEITNLQNQLSHALRTTNRLKLVSGKYPDLLKFEAKGLLPTAETDEELEVLLGEFRDALTSAVGATVEEKIKGAGPQSPSGKDQPVLDADSIYQKMLSLAGSKNADDRQKYDELAEQWMKLHK